MTIINLHPRRAARQCVLKALFAYQFSTNDTIDQLISENPELKRNNDFIQSKPQSDMFGLSPPARPLSITAFLRR